MNYIADTLGIEVTAEPWDGAKHLTFYLADAYNFQLVTLGNVRCLFVKPESDLAAISAIKKHFFRIMEDTDVRLVFAKSRGRSNSLPLLNSQQHARKVCKLSLRGRSI